MSEAEKNRSVFSLKDIASLRGLVIALGIVFTGLCIVGKGSSEVMLLGGGLVIAMMLVSTLAIFLLRRRKFPPNEKDSHPPEPTVPDSHGSA